MFRRSVLPLLARRQPLRRLQSQAKPHADTTTTTTTTGIINTKQPSSSVLKSPTSSGSAVTHTTHTTTVVNAAGGKAFAMNMEMANTQRRRLLLWNTLIASVMTGFIGFVYFYSIYAVRQDDITDAYLEQIMAAEEAELALIQEREKEADK